MPGGPGEAICSPNSRRLLPIHFEQLDVDDDFRPRLVDGRDDPAGGRQPFRRVLDRDGVGARHAGQPAQVHDDAQQVDGVLQLGVAQVERAHDLVFVLAALGGRVGHDRDRARRGDLEEITRARGHRREGRLELGVAQLDGDRRVAERRVEHHVDVGQPRDDRQHVADAGIAKDHRRGRQLHVARQFQPGRLHVARAFDERLEPCLAVDRCGELGAETDARPAQLGVDVAVGGVHLGGQLQFDQRVLELAGGVQPASACEMQFRRRAAWRGPAPGARRSCRGPP